MSPKAFPKRFDQIGRDASIKAAVLDRRRPDLRSRRGHQGLRTPSASNRSYERVSESHRQHGEIWRPPAAFADFGKEEGVAAQASFRSIKIVP